MKNLKIILCLLVIIGFPALTQAQLVKGDDIISGTFNLNSGSSSTTSGSTVVSGPTNTNVNISVSGMRLVNEQAGPGALGLGLRVSLLNNIQTAQDGDTKTIVSSPTYEIAPFARSYFQNTRNLGLFAEGMVGLSFGSAKTEVQTSTGTTTTQNNTSGLKLAVRPGFHYFLNDNIGLEFMFGSLGYQSTTTTLSSTSKKTESDFGVRLDLSTVQVGIAYKL